MTISISPEPASSTDGRRLTAQLEALLTSLYPPGTDFGDLPEEHSGEGGDGQRSVFLVARLDGGEAVGCGALRPMSEDTAEIKRMFVVASARRNGIARLILRELEEHARARGYRRIVLSTGRLQQPALALYEAAGYSLAPPADRDGGWPHSVRFERLLPDHK